MSGLLKWACSFLPGSEVTVHTNVSSKPIYCGEKKLLCSIKLTDPKARFTSYHKNEIKVLSEDGSVFNMPCKINIQIKSELILDVYCMPKQSGRAFVQLDLGNWYTFKGKSHLNVDFLPASPAKLNITKATCLSKSSEFKPKPKGNAFYYGAWSNVQASILDQFGNLANQVTDKDGHEVFLEAFNNEGTPVTLHRKNAKISNGQLCVDVLPKEVGQLKLNVQLNNKKIPDKESVSLTTNINVLDPPCSPSLSKIEFNDKDPNPYCIAGSEYKFQLHLYDVFGNPVRQTSTAPCNIDTEINPEFSRYSNKRYQEYIQNERDTESGNLRYTVTVGLKTAGLREVKVTVNSKYVDAKKVLVQVLPSKPHSLTQLRYITKSSKDPNFTADPKLLYNNQWSTLEAVILDDYNNVVKQMDGNCNVRLESKVGQEKPIKVSCKDAVIKDGILRLQVKGEGVGRQDFLPTLSSNCKDRPTDEYKLKSVQLKVIDAPISITLSEIEKPGSFYHTPISRKSDSRREILPPSDCVIAGSSFTVKVKINDVFGKPANPDLIESISAITSLNAVLKSRIIPQNSHSYLLEISVTNAGRHSVYIQLNGKIIQNQSNSNLDIHVLAASPESLDCLKATCRSKASGFKPKGNAFYYGAWSNVQASIFDQFGNLANQETDKDGHEVLLEAFNNEGTPVTLHWENAKISNGQLCVDVLPMEVGQLKLNVRLNNKKNPDKESVSLTTNINVLDPPCSPSLSKIEFNDKDPNPSCIAGSEYKFQLHLYDVFGNPVRQTSTAPCNIDTEINPEFSSYSNKRYQEYIQNERDTESGNLRYTVTVGLKTAGLREVKVTVQNSKYAVEINVPVQVLPSKPHSLTQLRYITKSSKDPNFTADPKLLYNNQWSTLEAVILDEYNNVVKQMDGNCNVRLESKEGQEKPIKVSCKDAVIKDGILRSQVKGEGVERQDFLPTLSSNCKDRPTDEYKLKSVQLEVIDPPFSLNLSQIEKPDSCVAGTESKIRLIPFDVFGNPFMANSTVKCNLSGTFLDSQSQSTHKKERISCNKAVNSSNYLVEVLLTRAGERSFEILDNENDSAKLKFSLEVKPDESNVHWDVMTTEKENCTYKNERLTLTAQLLDHFGNKVVVHPSYQSQLLQESGPENGLVCRETSISGNTISIEYRFTKKGTYVLSLQLHGHVTEKSINVQDPPVDPDRSTVTWLPKYDDQPLFPDETSFLCRVNLKDVHGNNYEGDVNRSNLTIKCEQTEVAILKIQPVDNGSQFDVTVSLEGVLDIENVDLEPEFWFFFDGKKITRSLELSFDGFQEYDDDDLVTVKEGRGEIYCRDVMKREIIGPDFSHLNNIKRVCELYEDPEIREYVDEEDKYIKIQLPNDKFGETRKFYETLLHLLKALYYREQAFEADKEREHWKEMAIASFNESKRDKNADRSHPKFCSDIKKKYATLMNEYHNKACDEYFQFFNTERSQSEIDLHGLLVVDEKKLADYKQQLRDKNEMSNKNVKEKIREEREKGDEAIRKLRERLSNYDIEKAKVEKEPWLEIIVGSGHHSKSSKIKDRQKIRPKVEKYLRENHPESPFSPVNKGALVITYEEYRGREPCFGEYYCEKCNHRWRNGRSWVGKWQACYNCYEDNNDVVECFPLKQRLRRKWLPYKPTGAQSGGDIPHMQELCQKCQELGEECPKSTGY